MNKQKKQEVVDKIWQTYVVDGAPLGWSEDDGECVYHSPSGVRCWVGFLLDEASAKHCQSFNGPVQHIAEAPTGLQALIEDVGMAFLISLQSKHDSIASDDECREGVTEPLKRAIEELCLAEELEYPGEA